MYVHIMNYKIFYFLLYLYIFIMISKINYSVVLIVYDNVFKLDYTMRYAVW